MEYIAGETLAERVAKGPLPVEDALAADPRRRARPARGPALGLHAPRRQAVEPDDRRARRSSRCSTSGSSRAAPPARGGDGAGRADHARRHAALHGARAGARRADRPARRHLRARRDALSPRRRARRRSRPTASTQLDVAARDRRAPRRAARPRAAHRSSPRSTRCVARMMAPSPGDRFASYDELLHAIDVASSAHTRPAGFVGALGRRADRPDRIRVAGARRRHARDAAVRRRRLRGRLVAVLADRDPRARFARDRALGHARPARRCSSSRS